MTAVAHHANTRCPHGLAIEDTATANDTAYTDEAGNIVKTFTRAPAIVSRSNPYVLALREAVGRTSDDSVLSIGRDGASDVNSFLDAGVPAVEFGPIGGGHHGPHEWVSIASLRRYRQALGAFVHGLPAWLERVESPSLRAVEGGLA